MQKFFCINNSQPILFGGNSEPGKQDWLAVGAIRTMNYFVLAVLWIIWCAIHSAMISVTATEYLKRRFGSHLRFYRLLFNLVAIATLIPVILYGQSIQGPVVFRWEGFMIVFQVLLLTIAVLLFFAGARHYDMLQFLGLRQIRTETSHGGLTETGTLDTTGILGITRHPWYLATIILIWARGLEVSILITNIILTIYLIVGTILEERKLLIEFGEDYRRYQKKVSMLIPFEYLKSKIQRSSF
jgi:protein-S-isoprenylcysteine O-methyltransferase Ste14